MEPVPDLYIPMSKFSVLHTPAGALYPKSVGRGSRRTPTPRDMRAYTLVANM